jgi:hypothetical protein
MTSPIERRRILRDLIESEGWKVFAAVVQAQQDARVVDMVSAPLETLDGALRQEFTKGGIAAVQRVMQLPEVLIDELTQEIEKEAENVETDE